MTLKLTSWDDFYKAVEIFKRRTDYFWRGHRCENWKLESSFDHHPQFKDIKKRARENKLQKILDKFKQRLADLTDTKSNSLTEDEIWAIGQHYRLPGRG